MDPISGAASAVAKPVTKKVVEVVFEKCIYQFSLRSHIRSIEDQKRFLLGIILDAESRRKLQGDKTSLVERGLVQEIQETIDQIDDLLHRIHFHSEIGRLVRTDPWYVYPYKGTICFFKEKMDMYVVGEKIKSIDSRIAHITSRAGTYGGSSLSAGANNIEDISRLSRKERGQTGRHDLVVGFDDHVKQIVRYLFDRNKARLVVSIEGLGGQGKTTLARQVCKTIEISKYFQSFVWISIPPKCTRMTLLKKILREVMRLSKSLEITKEGEMGMKEEKIEEKIVEYLRERKYLIILDNLWSKNIWDEVREAFPNTLNGSRILVTTRDLEVSEYVHPCLALKINYLDGAQSLELLRDIFPNSNVQNSCNLEKPIKELVKKCGGSPLALVLLGGLLFGKSDENLWCESELKNFPKEKEKICQYLLDLNYDNLLNPYIRYCFLYISLFPENSSISTSRLFRLWVAEGFIQREQGRKQEEIAKIYLNVLIQRGLVQVVKKYDDNVKRVRVHDVIRDWSIELAMKYWFFKFIDDMTELVLPTYQMVTSRSIIQNKDIDNEHAYNLRKSRTIIGLNLGLQSVKGETFKKFSLLRVLDLRASKGLKGLVKQIGKMKNLKYLGLRDTDLEKLPSSIENLLFLETLDARGTFLKKIPGGIWKIRTLKHVFLISSNLSIPANGTTTSLLTLWLHYREVRDDKNHEVKNRNLLSRFVEEQTHLSYLKLTTHNESSIHTALINKNSALKNKNSDELRILKLRGQIRGKQLPDHALFPQGIRELVLEFTHLEADQIKTLEKLRRLVILKLGFMAFEKKSIYCSSDGFHELQHLEIHHGLISEGWTVENGALGKLGYLKITHCFDMKQVPEALQNLTALKEARFQWIRTEVKSRLKNKEGDDWKKMKHVPSIIFDDIWTMKSRRF